MVIAATRIVFGLALIGAADASRAPAILRIFGLFVFLVGFLTPFADADSIRAMIGWWSGQSVGFMRTWMVYTVLFWLSILYAVMPRHWFASPREHAL